MKSFLFPNYTMVTPSTFYSFIGDNGYRKLIESGVIVDHNFKHIEMSYSGILHHKVGITSMNDQAYGKFIEQVLYSFLKGETSKDKFRKYLPDFNIENFIKTCSPCHRVSSGKDIKYDMILGDYLIDIKTYKHKFTKKNFKSFYLQLITYYSLLLRSGVKGLKYLAILNPVSGDFYYTPVPKDIDRIIKIYKGCDDVVDILIKKSGGFIERVRTFFRKIKLKRKST